MLKRAFDRTQQLELKTRLPQELNNKIPEMSN